MSKITDPADHGQSADAWLLEGWRKLSSPRAAMAIMTGNLFDQIDSLAGRDAIRYRHPGQLREPARHGFHGILTGTATANLVTGLVTISGGHALLDAVNIQAPAHVVR